MSDIAISSDARYDLLTQWLTHILHTDQWSLTRLAGDASFRNYYRLVHQEQRYVVMDADPNLEKVTPFIETAQLLARHDLCVPDILARNVERGFLLISDLGDDLLWKVAQQQGPSPYYENAISDLCRLQTISKTTYPFAYFDREQFLFELMNFTHWYLQTYQHWVLSTKEQEILHQTYDILTANALEQPQVCVHRDYHSRNLIVVSATQLGVLDFQDLLWGPVTYDLVSLLRDCYITLPPQQVDAYLKDYLSQAKQAHILEASIDTDRFRQWFDLMGVQRHIKAIFIFARKYCRDGNDSYLQDIPRAFSYLYEVCPKYPALQAFHQLLQRRGLYK